MSLFARKDSPFWWFWLEGTRLRENTRIRVDAPTEEERRENKQLARQIYNARLGDVARARYDLPGARPATTFATFASWYTTHVLPKHRGAEREREILPRLIAAFGRVALQDLTRRVVDEWVTLRLQEKRTVKKRTFDPPSPSTVDRELDVLKAILQAAVPEYLDASPLFGMKRLHTLTPKRRLLTEAEEDRLLAVMDADDRALFLVGRDSLVRLSDILNVKKTDDHGAEFWIANPKTGGGFLVPISSRARAAIDEMPETSSAYVFGHRRGPSTERDRRKGIRQMLKMYCRLADPPIPYGRKQGGITFHWATRRTGATRMLTRGVDLGTVQKVGRWKTAAVVLGIYHELVDDHARAAVERAGQKPNSNEIEAGADRPQSDPSATLARARRRRTEAPAWPETLRQSRK